MVRRAPVIVVALAALLALPAGAQAAAPWPCITGTTSLLVPVEGVPHPIDASCSQDPDGHDLVNFEWDLDGDGTFETSTGTVNQITPTFTNRAGFTDATVRFAVRVTDVAGESASYTLPLKITDRINSWFNFAPQLVNPGDSVALTGSTKHVDATVTSTPVMTYAWDLDDDGVFETDTGMIPAATYVAPAVTGRRAVRLRVTDADGAVSIVKREIEVLPRHPSRDGIAWDAPANLGDVPTLVVVGTNPANVLPVGPAGAPAADDAAAEAPLRRPTLRRVDGNRLGVKLRYTGGPKWSRWKVVVRLPARRAANYGLPRRTFVMARGTIVFDGRGVGTTSRMRWTKGAYSVFRRVHRGRVDILARRVA